MVEMRKEEAKEIAERGRMREREKNCKLTGGCEVMTNPDIINYVEEGEAGG
jgi:hypothetical protein